jgi:hypothetical protein
MRRLIDLWFKPFPNLGFHLTCTGIVMLMATLILNRLVPEPLSYDPDDWRSASLVLGYVVAYWAVWIVGVCLVIVGGARILSSMDE